MSSKRVRNDDTTVLRDLLSRALAMRPGSFERWIERRRDGRSDHVLLIAMRRELGVNPCSEILLWDAIGGAHILRFGTNDVQLLQRLDDGNRLVCDHEKVLRCVREIFKIPLVAMRMREQRMLEHL